MSDAFDDFDNRLRRIDRSRANLARGYVSVVGEDGLIIVKPRRKRGRFPLRVLAFAIIGYFGFKVVMLSFLGTVVYQDRIETLRQGSTVEQVGAWVMQADPASVALAENIRSYLP